MSVTIDADNPVVRLCAEGMLAEGQGADEARALFERAWRMRSDHFEASIAAHYLARHQPSLELALHWNEVALTEASLVADTRTRGLLPSLHLNLGKAFEDLGRMPEAREQYALASVCTDALDDDGYGQMMRQGIAAGLERTRSA